MISGEWIPLPAELDACDDLSGLVQIGPWLLLGNDEGRCVTLLHGPPRQGWSVYQRLALADAGDEVDIEALDYADGHVYVIGSHSRRRRSLRPETLSVAQNRKRFFKTDKPKARSRLYRIPFDPVEGRFGKPEHIDLSKRLRKHPLLGPFTRIPSKENGVDIEALTLHRDRLYLGFRGPVLRYNLVPVMVLDFDHPKDFELRFVQLGGQGLRDMVAVDGGFILLSGPVSDAAAPFQLWFWDGRDQLPGTDRRPLAARHLGMLALPDSAKAEGLALLHEDSSGFELLLIYDGVPGGRMTRVCLPRG
jgi:hypothetical protein